MTDPNHNPQDQAKQPGSPPKKGGFFQRLFGATITADGLTIVIAPFIDASGMDHARHIASVFTTHKGLRVVQVREQPVLMPGVDRADNLPTACTQAMNWIGTQNADLVIWGDVPAPGTTLHLHFAAPPPVDEDPAGTISPFQALTLPVGFDPETLGALLLAASLAAMNPANQGKRQTRRGLVAQALEQAAQVVDHLPRDFTAREAASVHAMFANSLASFAHLFPGTEVYQRASQSYGKAILTTLRADSPTNWAYLQRNHGTVLQALGERTGDVTTLQQAAKTYRLALEVFTYQSTPFPWATTQNRLGEVLNRLDLKSGETAGLKEALVLYQNALKVLNKSSTPLLWSETLNNLAQTAQVLGRELGNRSVIERAVSACNQALTVRTRETQPTLWAATQNNMGSALFLLGRMTSEEAFFVDALTAFMGAREVYQQLGLTRMVAIMDKNIAHAEQRLPTGAVPTKDKNDNEPGMWWLEEDENS